MQLDVYSAAELVDELLNSNGDVEVWNIYASCWEICIRRTRRQQRSHQGCQWDEHSHIDGRGNHAEIRFTRALKLERRIDQTTKHGVGGDSDLNKRRYKQRMEQCHVQVVHTRKQQVWVGMVGRGGNDS